MESALRPKPQPNANPIVQSWNMIRWNLSRALVVTRREMVDMLRDWRILAPIFVLSVIFPFIANWGAGRLIAFVDQYGALIVGERLIPFLLLVVGFFPISFSLIIALESFAGEKERRSLEPLLNSPLTDLQLYLGKMIASTAAPIIGATAGITVYLVSVYFSVDYQPPLVLLVQIFALTIMQAVMMVSAAVVVSSLSTSVRAANLLASFIIIPVTFLIQLEAFVMFFADYGTLWWIFAGMLMITIVLIRMGLNAFNREVLLGSDIDELDLGKGLGNLVRNTLARREDGQRNVWQWYRAEVLAQLPKLLLPSLAVLLCIAAGVYIGYQYGLEFPIPEDVVDLSDWEQRFPAVMGELGLEGFDGIRLIIVQNLRVLVLGLVLGIFTLGIAMVLLLMLPFAVIGFVFSQVVGLGLDPNLILAALIPHGIFEIPALIFAGATVMRLGAVVMASDDGISVGESWSHALADLIRFWVFVVLPLLLIAAVVEVTLTPRVVLNVIGG